MPFAGYLNNDSVSVSITSKNHVFNYIGGPVTAT